MATQTPTRPRRLAAAALIAVSLAAIVVHGRAGRPAQPQFAKTAAAEALDRRTHA